MKVERDAKGLTERGWIDFGFQNYYALLDCGFRLRPTAGTASGVHPVPLGFGRVYVHLDGRPRRGRLAQGPGRGPELRHDRPDALRDPRRPRPGHRFDQADAGRAASTDWPARRMSAAPLERIEVVVNGEVARTLRPANRPDRPRGVREPDRGDRCRSTATSWVAVRCFEDRPDGRVRFAHSGPFHIDVPGKPLRPRKDEVEYLIRRVEEQIARSAGVLPGPALDEYRAALRAYRAIAETAR